VTCWFKTSLYLDKSFVVISYNVFFIVKHNTLYLSRILFKLYVGKFVDNEFNELITFYNHPSINIKHIFRFHANYVFY